MLLGIATVSALEITDGTTSVNKHSVGIGTTTTAGRNAGVSTAPGTMIYNATSGKVQIYVSNEWKNIKLQATALTLSYLVIGGGGNAGGGTTSVEEVVVLEHIAQIGIMKVKVVDNHQVLSLTGINGTAYSIVVGAGGAPNVIVVPLVVSGSQGFKIHIHINC